MSEIEARVRRARDQIADAAARAGRDPDEVTLVAVTKTVPVEPIRDAFAAGLRAFGENRVQEGATKIAALGSQMPGADWHLIGHLQSNKVKPALEAFSIIESVDSTSLAQRIDRLAELVRPVVPVLLEVNVAGEESKAGFSPEQLEKEFSQLMSLPHLELRGLMTVAPLVHDPEEVRPVFARLRRLRDSLRDRYPLEGFGDLSMGMSNDYCVAVEEGATIVRVGRALFGERPSKD